MALPPISHRRLLLPLILAIMLVGEAAGLAIAARTAATTGAGPSVVATSSTGAHAAGSLRPAAAPIREGPRDAQDHPRATIARAAAVRPAIAVTARAATVIVQSRATASAPASYRGRNHVWIPSLGINRSIASFPCSRSQAPGNRVYRWGCAGANNIYLMGHAYSVFKPLHDAYVNGRLKKGMKVIYADGSGRIHTYSVIWWKVTKPTTSASWAWAAQSKPSMTLQTCVGARGELRLMVRLVAID
jgi:sortase (surface protein transpeptidase)